MGTRLLQTFLAFVLTMIASCEVMAADPAEALISNRELSVSSIELAGMSEHVIRALTMMDTRVDIRGFTERRGERVHVSVVSMAIDDSPVDGYTAESLSGRLRRWSHGLLLESSEQASSPRVVGGPLEPVLASLAEEGRRLVRLTGVWRSGVFIVTCIDLQPDYLAD